MPLIEICESNGAEETVTHDVEHLDFGSTEAAELVKASNPITPGQNSYEKWFRLHVTDLEGASSVSDIKLWRTGALSGADAMVTNARESSYGGAETYAEPVATTSTVADQTMPSTEPTGANVGIGGSLAGELTDVGYSDYMVVQVQVDAATTEGATPTLNIKRTVVA